MKGPLPLALIAGAAVLAGTLAPKIVSADGGSAAASTPSPAPEEVGALTVLMRQADGWLLAGEGVPPELPRLLEPLRPADRLTAVAYLRRLGVLEGPALDVGALLEPAGAPR